MRSLLRRIARNPRKYFKPGFWKMLLPEVLYRARAYALFAAPSLPRRGRPLRAYVFPSPMDRYQLAETYVAWKVLWMRNVRMVTRQPELADIAIAWNPSTSYSLEQPALQSLQGRMRVINARCTDIRKSTVGKYFSEIFGYSLEINPLTYEGTILRKSEANGAHDAVLLQGPLPERLADHVYQRLVSYPAARGMLEWRVFIVGGKPVALYRLYGPADDRFDYTRESAEAAALENEFSAPERQKIAQFNERIGLDFGVLDILRDACDGRMYISDCNNTPTGPSPDLPLRDQLRVMTQVAAAFEREYLAPLRAARHRPAASEASAA